MNRSSFYEIFDLSAGSCVLENPAKTVALDLPMLA